MRKRARTDDNQAEIVAALRAVGCSVQILSAVGSGCPDILVGVREHNLLMEIKDGSKVPSKQALTTDERLWHIGWRGNVCVVRSVEDALSKIQHLS